MTNRILCVDDDANLVQALERQLRTRFDVRTATGPDQGLRALAESGPFAVVISDLRMPGMNGIDFLSRVRQTSPDTIRMMLTGNADLSTAVRAVNDGQIFQLLMKPCPGDTLTRALESALKQYRLVTAERELLEQTLQGSISVLVEILSLANPAAFSRTDRIRRYVCHIAEKLKLQDRWQYELAATLSQIGWVVVPPDTMEKSHRNQPLSTGEQQVLASRSEIACKLLAKIPRLDKVAQMIAYQHLAWPGADNNNDEILIGGHLLRIALDLDNLIVQGKTLGEALFEMRRRPREYNPTFLAPLRDLQLEGQGDQNRLVTLNQLRKGMIIEADLYSKTGLLLLAKGHEVTDSAIARLDSFASLFGVAEPISVIVPASIQQVPEKPNLDISAALAGIASQFGLTARFA